MENITDVVAAPEETQPEQIAEQQQQPSFATVAEVYTDGLTLLFDGEEEPGEKHYKCNTSVVFAAGDRVKIAADSGTYVVEYVVGSPKQSEDDPSTVTGIPAGGALGTVLRKKTSSDYDVEWSVTGLIPSGGSSGQYLYKTGSGNYAVGWTDTPTADKLVNGNYELQLSSAGVVTGKKNYPLTLGNATYPLTSVYTTGGTFGTSSGKIGFFGATPIAVQTLSTTSNNMSYSSATASNYLYILNNVVGILKKLGLMK